MSGGDDISRGVGNRIKGGVLVSRLAYIPAVGGAGALLRVMARLSAADREILQGYLLPTSWYPLDLNLRLDNAIAEELFAHDPRSGFLEMGRASAQKSLTGSQSMFLKAGDPHFLLAQAQVIYRMYYAVGKRSYEKSGPKSAVLRTSDAEAVTTTDCLTVVGWHIRALELCGASGVVVTEPRCRAKGDPVCEYELSWQ